MPFALVQSEKMEESSSTAKDVTFQQVALMAGKPNN